FGLRCQPCVSDRRFLVGLVDRVRRSGEECPTDHERRAECQDVACVHGLLLNRNVQVCRQTTFMSGIYSAGLLLHGFRRRRLRMPRVRPLHQLDLFPGIPFLDFADKFLVVPFDLLQIIIGNLPHFCFKSPLKWVHFPLSCSAFITSSSCKKPRYRSVCVASDHHAGTLSDIPTALGQATRADRPVITWIATNAIPTKNNTHEIWTATADTPARFRAPAITPTTRNTNA